MRHYKIVKRGTVFSIVLATLAVFLQLGLAVYTLNTATPTPAKAALAEYNPFACTNDTPADVRAFYTDRTLNVELMSKYANVWYSYDIFIIKGSDGTTIDWVEGTVDQGFFPYPVQISIPESAFGSSLTIDVDFHTNVQLGAQDCPSSSTKNVPSYNYFSSGKTGFILTTDRASVDLQDANGKPITSPTPVKITYGFTEDRPELTYYLYVTDCAGADSQKDSGSVTANQHTKDWTPSELDCPTHTATITLKTFDPSTNMVVNSGYIPITINNGTMGTAEGNPDAGKLPPQDITIDSNFGFKIGTYDVKLYSITNGLGLSPIFSLIINIMEYFIGILAFVGLVYGGIMYITAGGDDAKAEKGKKTILYSIVGIIVALLAASIVLLIKTLPNGPG